MNGLKIEATLRRISAMEYFWHAAKRGLFVRPIDCWRGFFKAPDQLLISEHFPTRQVLAYPFGQYLLGTDILFTIRDWQKKACEIKIVWARTAIENRQACPRFPLLSEPGVLVTAIASLYSGGAFISRFMENIVSQSIFKSHCELIIIDANSPDNEHEVIKEVPGSILQHHLHQNCGLHWHIRGVESRAKSRARQIYHQHECGRRAQERFVPVAGSLWTTLNSPMSCTRSSSILSIVTSDSIKRLKSEL